MYDPRRTHRFSIVRSLTVSDAFYPHLNRVTGLHAGEPPVAKPARAAPAHWFPAPGEPSNLPEMLFLALLVLQRAIDTKSVQQIDAWAKDASMIVKDGTVPDGQEWRMKADKPGVMIEPIFDAHRRTSWSDEALEKIACAMHNWHGPGRFDGLNMSHMKDHRKRNPGGPKAPGSKKKVGPARIISAAVPGVVDMINKHGLELRKLLKSDAPRGPTMAEKLADSIAREAVLASEVTVMESKLETKTQAHKKAAQRLKAKNKAATDARKNERKKLANISKAQRQAFNTRLRAAREHVQERAGRGTRTRSSTKRPASSGWCCCQRSGIRANMRRYTAGASTRASSAPRRRPLLILGARERDRRRRSERHA
jgi:hypothetical protein